MCRLFGFRSVIPSQVHRSLLAADNALGVQSMKHPDGWGVAYYLHGAPHLIKSADTALDDHLFRRLSGIVSSETVVAHVRKATVGETTLLNSHPFQFGPWVFAHNGEVPEFEKFREVLISQISPNLRSFILGDTDSEVCFFIFLSILQRYGPLERSLGIDDIVASLKATTELIDKLCKVSGKPNLLTFLVTNGTQMAAIKKGKELHWSTYKTRCSDRETCPNLAPECEGPTKTGFVNHLIFSSESLGGENIWNSMEDGETVGVDGRMRLYRSEEATQTLPVIA